MSEPPFDVDKWAAALILTGTESITPTFRRILLTLTAAADESGHVQVSRPRLAARADVSQRLIQRILRTLAASKWLEVLEVGGPGHATVHALRYPPDWNGAQ